MWCKMTYSWCKEILGDGQPRTVQCYMLEPQNSEFHLFILPVTIPLKVDMFWIGLSDERHFEFEMIRSCWSDRELKIWGSLAGEGGKLRHLPIWGAKESVHRTFHALQTHLLRSEIYMTCLLLCLSDCAYDCSAMKSSNMPPNVASSYICKRRIQDHIIPNFKPT
jgi:hypothetical protein